MTTMNLDEFLGHTSTARGGGKILNWKKRNPAQIDTWLHTRSSIIALWRHGWPRIVEIDRDGEQTREVWGGNFNCWESEDVLKRQYKRTDNDDRLAPPQVCPICLLLEYVRGQVRAGKLSWVEPVFRFEGDDPEAAQVLTAGGLYNAFGGDLSRQEVADLRRAGIRRDEAWKQSCMAKCSYVFSIVDQTEPEKGVQTAIETTALGDAVKRVIRDQIDALGANEGHPLKHPYAIRWQYKPNEVEFSKKYHALAMPKVVLAPEIRELIFDSPAPDIGAIVGRGNVASLRAVMESHALIDLPFDRLFAAAEAQEQAPSPAPAARRAKAPAKAEPKEPTYPPGTVIMPCDACGAEMAETDDTCWKCGAKYELDAPPAVAPVKASSPAGGAWPGESVDPEVGF